MEYSNSSHFSDNNRHAIYIICICKIKDTIDISLTHFFTKKNKGEKGGLLLQPVGIELGYAGLGKQGASYWATDHMVKVYRAAGTRSEGSIVN